MKDWTIVKTIPTAGGKPTMKIAIVHSVYSSTSPSGENSAVFAQVEQLRKMGHEIETYFAYTDVLSKSASYQIRAGLRVSTGIGNSPNKEMSKFKPELIHVHNLFPNFGFRWLQDTKVPLIVTLHNYRPICASGILSRDGHDCDLCPQKSSMHGVRHKCYNNSRIETLPLAIQTRHGGKKNLLLNTAHQIICVSKRSYDQYSKYLPIELVNKMTVVPNFYKLQNDSKVDSKEPAPWIFAGRLVREKGILELIEGWPKDLALDIYGTGPCENDVRQLIRERGNIKLIGYVTELELMKALKRSRKFVFASTWSEGMPITFIQALAAGAAVISTRLNSVGDEVVFNKLGKTVMIPIKLGTLAASLEVNEILKFGDNARALYESTYTPEIWSNKILNVYESLKH